ncbi:uncharacterized protein LOC124915348 [Impatiens glandulifera]|uniref:uncharacterized protein LOC124915348 n=1 Tax=Impatiens glandulifera TaxID=253017 RepID=UPI001FB18416|nr:uncharacterized protein LOC124915348 [Impatiens glandulifera]
MFEHITSSEVAGYCVGALLLASTLSATKIDSLISSSQRSSLAMCKRCGDVKLIACSSCKGAGVLKEGGPFNFNLVYQSTTTREPSPILRSTKCTKCLAKGSFSCPNCTQQQQLDEN